MGDTVIIKRKVRRDFTTLPNDLIRDKRLSWGALGLLVFVLHLPDNFKLRLSHLAKQKANGKDATRARVKELEASGYLTITRERGENGQFSSTSWEVTDSPEHTECGTPPRSENPITVMPAAAKPPMENPSLLNTNTEQEQKIRKTTTTNGATGRDSIALSMPPGLSQAEATAITRALRDVPADDAQMLVDELYAAMESVGRIKTTKIRYFSGVLKKYRQDQFIPSGGTKIAERRARTQNEVIQPREPAAPELVRENLKNIRGLLNVKRNPECA